MDDGKVFQPSAWAHNHGTGLGYRDAPSLEEVRLLHVCKGHQDHPRQALEVSPPGSSFQSKSHTVKRPMSEEVSCSELTYQIFPTTSCMIQHRSVWNEQQEDSAFELNSVVIGSVTDSWLRAVVAGNQVKLIWPKIETSWSKRNLQIFDDSYGVCQCACELQGCVPSCAQHKLHWQPRQEKAGRNCIGWAFLPLAWVGCWCMWRLIHFARTVSALCQYSQSCLHSRLKTNQESKGVQADASWGHHTKRMEFSAKDCTERQYANSLFLFQVSCMCLSNSLGF